MLILGAFSVELDEEMRGLVDLDAECPSDDSDCSLSLRQLRGEKLTAEAAAGEEEDVDESEDQLFVEADKNGDGEVQQEEATGIFARLTNHTPEMLLEMFRGTDVDGSNALDTEEFATAMDRWASCSAAHRSFYCSGSTGVRCCKHGLVWSKCGTTFHHHSCFHLGSEGGVSCSSKRRSWYCSGTTKISCCKRNGLWAKCGSVRGFHGCR